MHKIKIGHKLIGNDHPCFIIAEAGINHNGSIDLAKRLIDKAKEAGASAIKFQTFNADEEVTKKTPKAKYQKDNTKSDESYYEMIKKLELNEDEHRTLMEYCNEKEIIFLSTPSEEKSAEMLNNLGVTAFKIGSNDIVTLPMLEKIAVYKKPIIISRGMATKEEIQEAIDTIKTKGNEEIIILHCTSNYPSKLKDLNLLAMSTIKQEFDVPVGFSDHSEGSKAPIIAVLLGAAVIEKHFTLDKNLPGPDHKFSIDTDELAQIVKKIRYVEKLSDNEKENILKSTKNLKQILGNSDIKPTKSEEKMRNYTRKSIVARYDIKKGEIITLDNIAFKRPAFGIPAKLYKKVIDKTTKSKIDKDEFITFEKLE